MVQRRINGVLSPLRRCNPGLDHLRHGVSVKVFERQIVENILDLANATAELLPPIFVSALRFPDPPFEGFDQPAAVGESE